MTPNTESEDAFELYLNSVGLPWMRIETGPQKQPDYEVEHNGERCLVEVKEFDDPRPIPADGYSPCPAIREKITQARKQFREHREHCCVLVLWNKSIYRSPRIDTVASAAFGALPMTASDLGEEPPTYRLPYRLPGRLPGRLFGPAELTSSQNTTISAIAVLCPYQLNHLWLDVWHKLNEKKLRGEEIEIADNFNFIGELSSRGPARISYEGTLRIVCIANPHARKPLPVELFSGPFDQQWSFEGDLLKPALIGSELQRLRREGVPFVYL